jgi:N6-L-threonylcarbamoyladenine synthase
MNEANPIILAIESSCDDTSAAVLKGKKVLANKIATQGVHAEFGGVVPELASRAHLQNIIPVVDQALKEAGVDKKDLEAIAYTQGPGLLGSLLVGGTFAKTMAMSLDIPIIEVNHMQGHILSHLIEDDFSSPDFPFLCLTVSGGHTQIVLVKSSSEMEVLGETIDDAAGEAFDKAAKIMDLPYPGGPLIDKHAKEGDPLKYSFTEAKVGKYEFSFSGLKTSFLYFLQKEMKKNDQFIKENLKDICASIQHAIVETLIKKLKLAIEETKVKHIAIAGGVSANSTLRNRLFELAKESNTTAHIPDFQYCTDNAGMIGIAAYYKFLEKDFGNMETVSNPRLKF